MNGENTAVVKLNQALNDAVNSLGVEDVHAQFTPPTVSGHGDRTTNIAMRLAKPLKAKPRDIAEKLAETLKAYDHITDIETAGPGFLNVFL